MADDIEVIGLSELTKQLDALLSTDPDMEKAVRGIIRDVLNEARSELASRASEGLQMKSDPRQAYRAIKTTVYRQILGGNVSILSKRKAGTPQDSYLPKSHTGRGGNRRPRSGRTMKLQSYWGSDRGFILRFLNQGTDGRSIEFKSNPKRGNVKRGSRGGDVTKYGKTVNTGTRGSIRARNWFGSASMRELKAAADNLAGMIEQLIAERIKA